ncbi:glycosyltransferase family 4 protein [Roseovarius sp. EGI FJ00037]|uniref:glycosyltransferase family 4 protein n=1 Tax=Roseovarius TaxID=74030 RepID=UPI0022A70BFD|nr:glycosyltransferase family 4 protein [Roseovarius sp. EGI FJ00037]MCZ0811250.1 glycosyltransferase family 4 protein [Roseovarius sp. EGI FJ00037]
MKITFVCTPPNLSGGDRVIAIYADLLTEMGHDVTIVAQPHPYFSWKQTLKRLLKGRRPRPRPEKSHFDGIKARLHLTRNAEQITDEDVPDADVVIATFWTTAYMVANLSASKGRKFYFVQHHEVHNPPYAKQGAASYRLPLRKIAVSSWLRDVMESEYGDKDVPVVPNAVDHDQFQFQPRSKRDAPTVSLMYSGKLFKGVDTSLKALDIVQARLPDLSVLAFGTIDPLGRLPLPDYTTYLKSPPQDEIPRIYAASDVYLFGSNSEGFGLPVLEAMACGCPVVATRTGCAPDVIEDGVSGYVVDIDDAEALADRIIKVLSAEPDDWKTMSRNAAKAVESYSWSDCARAFAACLEAPAAKDGA